jgi:hypothetical protein
MHRRNMEKYEVMLLLLKLIILIPRNVAQFPAAPLWWLQHFAPLRWMHLHEPSLVARRFDPTYVAVTNMVQ